MLDSSYSSVYDVYYSLLCHEQLMKSYFIVCKIHLFQAKTYNNCSKIACFLQPCVQYLSKKSETRCTGFYVNTTNVSNNIE
ncbi:hypothetical protein Hanom_Chr13g01215501 [Helianthus anomalus]